MSDIDIKTIERWQRQRLNYSRLWAISLLILAFALFVFSCLYLHLYPALSYLKAFAEAAMVGALADWFAITALFRRPLGLPIPHTAILVHKQNKIADELGNFIENNFLQSKAIATRVYQWHPTEKLLLWLTNPIHRQQWLPIVSRQIPILMHTAKPTEVARFISQLLDSQYSGQKLSVTLANILVLIQQHDMDNRILRTLLKQVRHWLQDPQTRTQLENSLLNWAGAIKKTDPSTWDKLKASLKTTLTASIDDWIAAKALDWADSYIAAALKNPKHALWRGYRKQLLLTERQLRRNPVWHNRLASMRHQLVYSKAFQQNIAELWHSLLNWSDHDIKKTDSWWLQQLNHLLNHTVSQFRQYPQFVRRLDTRLAIWTKKLIEQYKHKVSQFIADKVKSWDSSEMIDKIELSIGRDLQFIRINGTIVGGLIGLIIYTLSQWLSIFIPT